MPNIHQVRRVLLRAPVAAAVAAGPFDLDGTAVSANSGSTASLDLPAFSTTYGNDIVFVAVISNSTPNGVTASGLTFTSRKTVTQSGGGTTATLYSAPASSPLSSVVATCTSAGADFMTAAIFAVSGVNFASPYDGNAAIPSSSDGSGLLSFTTNNADDILIAMGVRNAEIDSPFTTVINTGGGFLQVGYRIVTATQSGATIQFAGANCTSVGDAVVKA
jgi:hypothetical protein